MALPPLVEDVKINSGEGVGDAMSPRSCRLRIKRVSIRSHRLKPPWAGSIPYGVTIVTIGLKQQY